jgi:hypothetical protein
VPGLGKFKDVGNSVLGHVSLLGHIPKVIGLVDDFVRTKSKREFLAMVSALVDMFKPFSKFLPAKDIIIEVAAEAYDLYKSQHP